MTLSADGCRMSAGTDEPLYYEADPEIKTEMKPVRMKLIPYYAWANRGTGEMRVWVNEEE